MGRANGDLLLEQGSGFGPSIDAFAQFALVSSQTAVDLARTDPTQLLFNGRRNAKVLFDPRHPERQQGHEAERPGIACHFPDGRGNGKRLG